MLLSFFAQCVSTIGSFSLPRPHTRYTLTLLLTLLPLYIFFYFTLGQPELETRFFFGDENNKT